MQDAVTSVTVAFGTVSDLAIQFVHQNELFVGIGDDLATNHRDRPRGLPERPGSPPRVSR